MGEGRPASQKNEGASITLLASERELVEALRRGDETAFLELVNKYQRSMVRIAMNYVSDSAVAEEVVQETWAGVLSGLGRFEGRSSLKTWIFRILTNRAKTRAERERRSIPISDLEAEIGEDEPAVEPNRFLHADHPKWAHHWASFPLRWEFSAEDRVLSREVLSCIQQAMDGLSPSQRTVITLRDIEEWTSEEVCNIFSLSETNQRVLLHRARSKVRRALELYFQTGLE